MKDGKLTQVQVNRRLKTIKTAGRLITVAGMSLLVASVVMVNS